VEKQSSTLPEMEDFASMENLNDGKFRGCMHAVSVSGLMHIKVRKNWKDEWMVS